MYLVRFCEYCEYKVTQKQSLGQHVRSVRIGQFRILCQTLPIYFLFHLDVVRNQIYRRTMLSEIKFIAGQWIRAAAFFTSLSAPEYKIRHMT